ncbi:MAG: kinase-like domain-containing protein, partial [Olpidium bornovanus]
FWLEILTAVQRVHEIGIGHRDLKPENYLISTKNSIMLTDFGLATKDALSTDWECGSRAYMAPEICERGRRKPDAGREAEDPAAAPANPESYDPRASDVWSLGVVYLNLHHLCSAWSSPDASCRVFHHFVQNPDAWLEDAGVENAQVREWLMTKVFVRPSLRCSVAEWLNFEKGRKLLAAASKPRPFRAPVAAPASAAPGPRGTAVPAARAGAAPPSAPARMAVSLPAETHAGPAAPATPPSAAAAAGAGGAAASAGPAPAAKRKHRRRLSWAYDLDFDANGREMDFSAFPVFAIEDVSDDDEDPFAARDSKDRPAEAPEAASA